MKNFNLSIFWKFSIGITIVVGIFGGINILLINNNIRSELQNESEKRGRYIATNLADQLIEPLLYEDYLTIQKYLDNIEQLDSSIVYAIVIMGSEKNQFLHNFDGDLPFELLHANKVDKDNNPHVSILTISDNKDLTVRDIAVPILSSEIGSVRIGILEESISKTIDQTTNNFILMVVIFLLIGIAGALFFSRIITNPIKEIVVVADELNLENVNYLKELSPQFESRSKNKFFVIDELLFLKEKFFNMIQRLIKAYEELKNTYAMLHHSEKLASIGTLSSGIAHEINNPNTGIQYCVNALKQNYLSDDQRKEYLELIEEASIKIENVVKGILEFSRPQVMSFNNIDLNSLIDKSFRLLKYQIEKNDISFNVQNNLINNYVLGSEQHLEQVIVNLLMNSIDAIVEKKSLVEFSGKIDIILTNVNEMSKIIIVDNGIGIDKGNENDIFNPFYTTKEVGKGTGLGLAICLNIIKDHKGLMTFKSERMIGTEFNITLHQGEGI